MVTSFVIVVTGLTVELSGVLDPVTTRSIVRSTTRLTVCVSVGGASSSIATVITPVPTETTNEVSIVRRIICLLLSSSMRTVYRIINKVSSTKIRPHGGTAYAKKTA